MKKVMKKSVALVVGALVLAAVAGTAQAATMFAVQDSNANDKMTVTDNGYIGVGTSSPTAGLNLTGAYPASSVRIEGAGTSAGGVIIYLNKAGTALPVANERLGFIYMGSFYNGVTPMNATGMKAVTEGVWTTVSTPAAFAFETTPAGGLSRVERMRIASTGNVGIDTITPTQRLEVNGGIRLNTAVTKPVCSATTRGTLWFEQGATDDILYVCAQSAGSPLWKKATLN